MTPEQARNQMALDAQFAEMAERLPALWRRIYENAVDRGFTKQESFILVRTFILAQCPYGVNCIKEKT